MSDEKIEELEIRIDAITKMVPLMRWLLIGACGVGAWTALIQYQVKWLMTSVEDQQKAVRHVELWRAETNGNRYTSADHNDYARIVQEYQANQDKRLTRLEDQFTTISESLKAIRDELKKKNP